MKARLLGAVTAAVMLLSGCTFSTSIDGLLSPPKLSLEQEQIYDALRRAAGSSISLKYPKTGGYLSAFIVSDIDGDGEDEALVFYEKNLLRNEENALRLNVLDQIEGSWRSVYDLAAGGAEVEEVMISRLGSNSRTNIIVGYSMVNQGERVLSVYDYRQGELTETLNSSYSLADVCDLDRNGENELLIVCGQALSQSARAMTYVLAQDGSYYESRVELNEAFTDFANLLYGNTAEGIPCVWLDGITGPSTVQTQVLTLENGVLTLLYSDKDSGIRTVRQSGYLTCDLDGDGVAEIPVNTLFPGYTDATESEQIPMTSWYECRGGRLMRKCSGYYSPARQFAFVLPRRWERKVTLKQDALAEELVFYRLGRSLEDSTVPLLRLCVTDNADTAQDRLDNGYILLCSKNGLRYLAQLPDTGDELALTVSEAILLFHA
ncbi:hypothetical protein [Ruminococcus sp.]|uniref:hypothetical protein n=1 Tax=Ruminococcus sp. TaxID=41978 RepID=UPI00261717AE|nr:hypothetical protein [Ruminococcus sp.]MDD7556893.1 hypothetical protein [Ruminococcus sp.]MDY4964409.1 hypothetical protein [Ruminococcus callidus]